MRRIFFLFLLVLALPVSTCLAQLWQQTNGVGGNGSRSIAVNSQGHIFLVSEALHRSTDAGITWKRIFPDAPGQITKVVIQPTGQIIVFIPTTNNLSSLYTSDDNGETWHDMSIRATAFFQSETGALFRFWNEEVWQSLDNGSTWDSLSTTGILGKRIFVTRDYLGQIFVCADYLYRSTDNGSSWSRIINDISINTSYISCAPDGKLYAVSSNGGYKSSNGGSIWTRLPFIDYFISASYDSNGGIFLLSPHNNQNIIFSTDSGATWTIAPVGKTTSTNSNSFRSEEHTSELQS